MKNKFYYFLSLLLWIMTSTNTLYAQAGAALNFDGVNDYVYITSPLNLNSNTASFEAWVKPATTVEPNSMIIGNRTDATPAGIIFTTTNRQIGYIWNNNYYSWAGGPVLAANTWSHVALVVEPTQATIYVNGTPYVSTGTHNAQAWSGAFAIGMDPRFDWGDRHFAGAIDEVRVWNRVLTQCDVQNNMNCELNVASQTGLVAYYKFNQGTNNANNSGVTTLTDASGNNRHGTLNNFSLTGTTSNWISGGGVTTGTTCTALTPTVSIAASPSNIISTGTSVTFTATPTNGGTTPLYQWKKNNGNVGSNSATYTNAALANNDIITCVMTSNAACVSSTTATSNSITMTVNPPGAALNFDGSNDNISLGTTLGNFGTSDFTIETYFKTASASNQHLITKRPTCGHESFWGLTMSAGKIYIEVDQNTSATNYYNRSTPNAYNDNNWHHVAAVRAGASLKLYVDGVLVASGSGAGTASLSNSTTLYIGSPNACSGSASYFNGSMDEIRIWNRALPECEIQNNRSCELGSGQTNLLAYYKFNQGVSSVTNTGITSLTDASGNANTGTLNNFALTGATSNWIATGGVTTGTTCTALPTPSVSIAASPSNSITTGTNVTFTATPTNGGTTPQYQWTKNSINVGSNSTTYTDAGLATNDVINCIMTSNITCPTTATAISNNITMTVNTPSAALNFDGIDDYVQLPSVLAIGGGDCTMECMVKVPTVGNGNLAVNGRVGVIMGNFASGATNTAGFEINNLGKTRVYWNAGNVDFSGNMDLRDDTWHHLAFVRNTALNKWFIYIDGILDNSNTSSGTNPTFSTTFRIGTDNRTTGIPYFHGSIDELRVWNRALSICEIQNNKSCELSSGQTGLLTYYKFNQGNAGVSNSGVTSLTDASSNAYTATLNNFALTGTTSNWIATGGVTTGTTCTAYAPYYTWTGATSTDWSTTTNWSCGVVPTSASSVTIPSTTNKPTLLANQTIGNLTLSGTNKIMLGSSNLTVNSLTGGSNTAYIVTDGTGTLTIKALSTSTPTTFPIGVSDISYDPLSIKPTNSVDFTAKVKTTTVISDFTGSIVDFSKVAKRQWDITPTGSAGSTVLTLTNGGTTYTPTTAKVGHYTSSNVWEELAATYNVGTWTATTTSFSPFGVGDAGGFFSVLSVEFLDFKATPSVSGNLLTWTTANEVNNKGFQVERLQSTVNSQQLSGGKWDVLGFVNAKGKSSSYDFTDNAPLSTSYYRLRQLDHDGKETFSKIVSVSLKDDNKLKVYPNPVSNVLVVERNGVPLDNVERNAVPLHTVERNAVPLHTVERNAVPFYILNLLGQQVLSGQATQRIDVSALPQGTYFLKVGAEQVKFVKQ